MSNTTANLVGYQAPSSKKKKLEACMEALRLLDEDREILFYRIDEKFVDEVVGCLDAGDISTAGIKICEKIEENVLRKMISSKLSEVVRKKKGGAGFTLYSPNKGKKQPAKPVASFPTKIQAKRAELSRFPPKDTGKLKRLRKEIDRLQKKGEKKPSDNDQVKKEQVTLESLYTKISNFVNEALFREEDDNSSQWDERMSKLSKSAIEADKKLQNLQKNIEKKSETTISSAFSSIQKALKPRKMTAKSAGTKKDLQKKKTFLQFSVDIDGTDVGPFFVFVENSRPKIEISDEAKQKLMKIEPEKAKLLRAELITAQEDALDGMSDVSDAISKRDGYLSKIEGGVDEFVAGLNALEISILKNLLVNKYRGK